MKFPPSVVCVALFVTMPQVLSQIHASNPVLQPARYASPSGRYSLLVDPDNPDGNGAARYRFLDHDQTVWSGRREYALRNVEITNDGTVVGYAYCAKGDESPRAATTQWFVHIVVLDSHGNEIANDFHQRTRKRKGMPPSLLLPRVEQLLVNIDSQCVIVRMIGEVEQWSVYNLLTGTVLQRFNIADRLNTLTDLRTIVTAQVVPDYPLILVHALARAAPDGDTKCLNVLSLLDNEFRSIWSRDWETTRDHCEHIDDAVREQYRRNALFVFPGERGAFRVRDATKQLESMFVVEKKGLDFQVVEVESRGCSVAVHTQDVQRHHATLAPPLGTVVKLATDRVSGSARIIDFALDARGRIYAWRQSETFQNELIELDQETGEILGRRPFEKPDSRTDLCWDDAPRWHSTEYLRIVRGGSEEAQKIFKVDFRSGVELELGIGNSTPNCSIRRVRRFPGGRFLVLESCATSGIATRQIVVYDGSGDTYWSERVLRDPLAADLNCPIAVDMAVTRDGKIALLCGDSILFLTEEGEPISKLDLKKTFQSTRYIPEVIADSDQGCVAWTGGVSAEIIRVNTDASVRERLTVRDPDGSAWRSLVGVRIDRQGRLWVSDGSSFSKLTDEGVVDQVIALGKDDEGLSRIIDFTTDKNGRLYAVAHGTGAVYVFDRGGTLLHVCKPNRDDFRGFVERAAVFVRPDGEVYLRNDAWQYIVFDARGERRGVASLDPFLDNSLARWEFQGVTGARCGLMNSELIVADATGATSLRSTRRPNGRWITRVTEVAVARNGHIATLAVEAESGRDEYFVDIYSPAGEPRQVIPLSAPIGRYRGLAYDGEWVATVDDEYVVALKESGSELRWAHQEPSGAGTSCGPFFLAEPDELVLFCGTSVVRYELAEIERTK